MRIVHSLLLLLAAAQNALCWGNVGHGTVAYVAQKYLTKNTAAYLAQVLVDEQGEPIDYFDAAIWPDEVKRARPYSKDWHYIDAQDQPPRTCQVNYPQDCTNSQHKHGCIIDAISNQTNLFLDSNTPPITRQEALKYLIHFVGDLHQPLHIEDAYRGGNEIHVCFGHACSNNNLHEVWDKYIPYKITGTKTSAKHDEEMESAQQWAEKLYSARDGSDSLLCESVQSPNDCSLPWAREANTYVCSCAMKESIEWLENNDLSGQYYEGAAPVVEYLIGRAGERLGVYLNALVQAAQGSAQQVPDENHGDLK